MRLIRPLFCSYLYLVLLATAAAGQRPNIVVLLADDLGSKDIGCDGGPVKTPALDELGSKGVRFTDFHSGAPVCSPARATLLTGRHHLRTGVYTVIQDHIHNMHLRKSEVTIAELLKANGYDTVHLGKWHLGTPFRGMKKPWIDEHGFDYWFATDLNAAPSHRNPSNFWRNRERVGELKGYACQLVVDEAITWLDEKRDAEKPFFLNIWFHEPHAPLAAPDNIVSQYGDQNDPAAIYSGTIDNTDRAIDRLLKKLKDIGSLENTIIIYTSDHGSYRPDRNGGLRGNKGSLFEGGIRTPGIVYWPKRIKGGRIEDTPAGAVDLLPTICGLTGIEKPDGVHLDGADLSPLLTGKPGEFKRHQPLTWHSPTSQPIVVIRNGKYSLVGYRKMEYPKDQATIRAVMDEMKVILEKKHDRKLTQSELWHKAYNSEIKTPEWNRLRGKFVTLNTFQEAWIPLIKEGSGGISRFELYNLSTDPNQQQNIAERLPEVTNRLKEQVLAINADVLKEAPDWSQSRLSLRESSARDPSKSENKPTPLSRSERRLSNWHQWRGPEANGVSRAAKPPVEWSEDKNVRWKVAINGKGNASPIIWGDKVFLLTAINAGRVDPSRPKPEDQPKRVFGIKHPNTFYKFEVLCLDRNTGEELWRQTASEHVPHEGTHHDADFASASPTTDGERLYCWFGSAGMHCYDLDGRKQWERNLGKAYVGASLGEACSPVFHQGKLVIVRDHARQSSIEVLDARTGKSLWMKDRDEPNAWATPRIVEHSGKTQVITAASNMIRSYDLDSGDIIWQCSGLTGNVIPCPVVDGDVVYCMSGYEGYSLLALPLDARGDISNSDKIIWSKDRGTPYVPSPVLYDGMLYFTQSNQSILTAVDSRTGKTLLQRGRIPGVSNIYSSPVGADGRVYFTGRNGATVVLKRQNKLKVLATNKLDDEFNASPAIAGRQLFLRGRKSLYCLENRAGGADSGKKASIEAEIRIHRLATTRRSAFDAFSYVNRIPEKPYDDETAEEFAGRIFSRLANQEGRVLLKAPPGMDRLAYDGFKTFLRYEGAASVGNCAACHTPADFTDGESHVVSKGGTAKPTPSLRNLVKRRVDLRKTLLQKLETSRQKRSGTADEISEAYSAMNLSERDIRGLAAFLKLLEDVPDDRFRKLILDAKVLNTSKE